MPKIHKLYRCWHIASSSTLSCHIPLDVQYVDILRWHQISRCHIHQPQPFVENGTLAYASNLNLLQNMLSLIWLSPAEIDAEKTAAREENALVSDYLKRFRTASRRFIPLHIYNWITFLSSLFYYTDCTSCTSKPEVCLPYVNSTNLNRNNISLSLTVLLCSYVARRK